MRRSALCFLIITLLGCDKINGDDTAMVATLSSSTSSSSSADTGGTTLADTTLTDTGAVSTSGDIASDPASTGSPSTTDTTGPAYACAGTFAPGEPIDIPGAYVAITANLDGDGLDDLVVSSGNTYAISAIPGATPNDPFFHASFNSYALAAADLDADGLTDIVSGQIETTIPASLGHLSTYLGAGSTSFTEAFNTVLPDGCSYPTDAGLADLDGDGHDDVMLVCDGLLVRAPGHGDGTFGDVTSFDLGFYVGGFELADVIGSPAIDILVYDQNNPRLLVYPGTGDFGFDLAGKQEFATAVGYGLVLGHLDADGILDAVVNHTLAGTCAQFHGTGDGLIPGPVIPCGPYAADIALRDLDGDGLDDMFMAHFFNDIPGSLHIRRNNGDGSFGEPEVHETPFDTVHLALGDYNGDGCSDIAITAEDLVQFFYQSM